MAQGSKLVIVESPTKAKKIGGYLGKDYTVMASVGHIRDLAQPSQVPASEKQRFGKFGVDVNDDFKPYYIVDGDKKHTVSDLKAALKKADELYLATDEDREGEAIAWHLVETLKPKVPVKRMVFHEITAKAIQASLDHTRDVDAHMVDAQETRRVVDRLYGYELSPVLWRKVGPGLSAGRVQSVATRLIVERERERMSFVKASYWDVVAQVSAQGQSQPFEARLVELDGSRIATSSNFESDGTLKQQDKQVMLLDQTHAESLAGELTNRNLTVASMETKPYRRRPVPPFTTSTLQQAAGNRLGMSSRQTMRAAQGLYENGFITYMRTDSVTLSQEAITAARAAVAQMFGEQYLSDAPKQYATTSAGAQEAHECIRPAGSTFRSPDEVASQLPPDQLKLYTLIWQRTLACQMADATGSTATLRLQADSTQGVATLQSSGTVIDFAGFLRAFGDAKDDAGTVLPPLSKGDEVHAEHAEADGHETQPPARYTEASLVRTLEAKEIGRPSTYASIISTIIDRGYVYERGRALIPSWLAFAVTKLLETKFPTYVDYAFTASMENGLDQIARGEETGKDWLTRFYFGDGEGSATDSSQAHEGLQKQVEQLGEIDAREINTLPIGDGINVRIGRYGPYLENTQKLDGEGNPERASIPDTLAPDELTVEKARELLETNALGPRVLGTDPATGGSVEVRNGRFGPYVALLPAETEDGETKESTVKPVKMASLFKTMTPESISLEDALNLLSLPREVGVSEVTNEKTGEVIPSTILANNGRYGPYLSRTGADGKAETRSLSSEDEIFTVTLEQAQELFAQPKYGRGRSRTAKPPLRELGTDPESDKPVVIKDGFYGAYITDGETNRTLPKQYTPESIEAEDAYRLLAEKRAAGPTKRRGRAAKASSAKSTSTRKTTARKSTAAKKTATKSAKSATKSSTTKKTAIAKKASTKTATKKSTSAMKSSQE